MKKLNKLFLSLLLCLPLLGALVAPAAAVNLDEAWMKVLDATNNSIQVSSTSSICANLRYVGTSTEAVVSITSFTLTAYIPSGPDSSFGTSGVYETQVAYPTMGSLCDAINLTSSYKCLLNGCKRNDSPSLMDDQTYVSGANNLGAATGYDILMDSGTVGSVSHRDIRLGINPSAGRRVLLKRCNASIFGPAPTLQVFGVSRKNASAVNSGVTYSDSNQVWLSTANQEQTWSVAGQGGLEFGNNQHVVVSGGNVDISSNTSAQGSGTYLNCQWEER